MAIWTVHEPPATGGGPLDQADRIEFVKDGLVWSALLLPAVWMLVRRLWLVLVLFVAVVAVVNVGLIAVDAPPAVLAIADLTLSVLVGLEAGTLRRWTLQRRGFRTVGVVSAPNLVEAERRFFDHWPGPAATVIRPPAMPRRIIDPGVIGFGAPAAGS